MNLLKTWHYEKNKEGKRERHITYISAETGMMLYLIEPSWLEEKLADRRYKREGYKILYKHKRYIQSWLSEENHQRDLIQKAIFRNF